MFIATDATGSAIGQAEGRLQSLAELRNEPGNLEQLLPGQVYSVEGWAEGNEELRFHFHQADYQPGHHRRPGTSAPAEPKPVEPNPLLLLPSQQPNPTPSPPPDALKRA